MARNKRISIDFSSSGLNNIVKELGKVKKTAGEVKLDSSATKHLNDVTEKVEELEEKLAKIERSKLDASQFKRFSDEIKQGFASIEESFRNLNVALKELGDNPAFQKIGAEVDKIAQKNAEAMKSVQSTIKETSKIINESAKASEVKSKSKTTPKTVEGLKSANESSAKQVSDIEKVTKAEQKKTDELNKQAKALEKINDEKTKSKSKSKSTQDVDAPKEKVLVDLGVVKGADVKLKDTISKIVNGINETNPTVEVKVAFVSNYKTRARQEIMQQLNENLDKAYEFTPKSKKAQDKFYGIIEDARAQFMKELNKDSMRLDFETNIGELKTEIPDAIQKIKEALGDIELDANVKINKEQIQEQLGELQNFTLTIDNIEFSKNFLDNINGAYKLIEEKEKVQKSVGDEDIVDDDQLKQLEDLISKATKVNDLIKHMSKTIGTIPLSAEFDKTQIQESLDQLYGLTLKISELDVENIKGAIGGNFVAGAITLSGDSIPVSNSTAINVDYSDKLINSEIQITDSNKKLVNSEKNLNNELNNASDEVSKFVTSVDKMAQSLLFTSNGKLSQNGEGKHGVNEFLTSFLVANGNKVGGGTLLDWASQTKMLGDGDIKTINVKILEDALETVARRNKILSPSDAFNQLKTGSNSLYTTTGTGASKIVKFKKGNEDAINSLFYSLIMNGVGKDAQHSLSALLPQDINRKLLNEIESLFRTRYPQYSGLRGKTLLPVTQKQQGNSLDNIDDAKISSIKTSDKLDELNSMIGEYAAQSKKSLDALDKSLIERLEEVQNVEEYKKLGKTYSKQKKVQEVKDELWGNIINSIITMSPQDYSRMMSSIENGEYSNIGKFVEIYKKNSPDGWARIQEQRNKGVEQELRRRLNRIEQADGDYTFSEQNEKALDELIEYLRDVFGDIKPKSGKFSFKDLQDKFHLTDSQIKTIQSHYATARQGDIAADALSDMTKGVSLTPETLNDIRQNIDDYAQQHKLSKAVVARMKELLDASITASSEALQQSTDEEKADVRAKTKKEISDSYQKQKKKQQVKQNIDKPVEQPIEQNLPAQVESPIKVPIVKTQIKQGVLAYLKKNEQPKTDVQESFDYDKWLGDVKTLIDEVTKSNVGYATPKTLEEANSQLKEYYDELAKIETIFEQMSVYRKQTGNKISDDEIFKTVLKDGFAYTNVRARYGEIQGYAKDTDKVKRTLPEFKEIGKDGAKGYEEGFEEEKSSLEHTTEEVIRAGIEAAKKAQDSHSPSKKYKQLGIWAVEGYLDAIDEMIPLVKDAASKIKLSPDGTLDNSEQNLKIYDYFVKGLKKLGATEVGLRNPNNDLSIFYEQMQRTNSGRISLSKSNSLNVEGFLNKYMQGYSADKDTFEAVMKSLEVNEEDSKILWQQLGKLLTRRHTEFTNRLKSLVSNLSTNKDGTFSKKNGVNDSKYNDLYDAYTSMRASTINKGGEALNKTTFNKFASDMGLSEENTKRMWDAFVDIFEQRKKQNELLKKQALQAIEDEKKAKQKANEDNLEQELKNIDEVSDKQEKANKEYEKQRRKLLEELKRISEDERRFPLESFREEAKNAYDKINNGEDLSIGENVRQRARDYGKVEDYWKLVGRANALINSNTNSKQAIAGARELLSALKEIDPASYMSANALGKISDSLGELEATSKAAGKTFMSSIVDRLRKANADFFARYLSIRDIIRYFREFMQTVTEFDTALTEMRKVSDESVASLKEYQKVTFDVADALGTTAVQVQQSTADWLRLGETMEQAAESAKVATTLFNVSEFENINDATTALVAMSQAYQDLDKTEIVDVMNNIGNNYSIATDKLALALQASASALMTQGNDLYEATALITAANAVVQDYSKAGTGMRTIALRIGGQRLDKDELKKELDELGEEVDDWVVQTESKKRQVIMEYTRVAANDYQGVDILDANGNLKDTYHIMLEISKVYKQIQEEDKKFGTNRAQGLVEELAGKTRANVAASILMNPKLLEDVYNSALNSQGSAAEENAKYLDSVVGKTQQLKNEWQKFQTQLLDSDLLKDLLDIGKILLSFVNQLIEKIPMMTVLVITLGLAIKASLSGWFVGFNDAGKVVNRIIPALKSIITSIWGIVTGENAQAAATAAANAQLIIQNTLWSVGIMAVVTGLTFLIKKIVTYRKELAKSAEEARTAIDDMISNLKEASDTVEQVGERYAELSQKVSDLGKATQSQGLLSTDEYKEFLDISNQLAELFPSLQTGFDDSGNAILKLDGSVNTIVSDLNDLVEVQQRLAQQKMLEGAEDIFKDDITKYRDIAGGGTFGQNARSWWSKKGQNANEEEIRQIEKQIENQNSQYNKALRGEIIKINKFTDTSGEYNDFVQIMGNLYGRAEWNTPLGKSKIGNGLSRKANKRMKEISTFSNGEYYVDYSKLTKDEQVAIENYYKTTLNTHKTQQTILQNELDSLNADMRKYMNAALNESYGYQMSNNQQKQIVDGILASFDISNIPKDVKDWNDFQLWFETSYISAIQSLDDKKLSDQMAKVLSDTTLNATEKVSLVGDILKSLQEKGYDEKHPLVIYWQSQYDGDVDGINSAVDHILGGMKAQSGDTDEKMRERAEEWVGKLTPEQLTQVLNTPIRPNTIQSYEDLLNLIKQINDETSKYESIGQLLSQDNNVDSNVQDAKESAVTWGDVRADLVGMAQSGKLDENTLRQYKYFNEIIKALGLSANVTDDELKTMIDEINKMAKGSSVDRLSDAKTNLDKLDSAYKKFQNKELVDSSSLNEVQDTFAYLGKSYRDFEDAVKRGESDLQPYFDNIATQYAIQEGLLEDLTEASEEWTVQQLVNAGITEKSAREGVALALKQKQMLEGTLLGQIRQINTVAALDEETKQYIATVTDLNSVDAKTISDLIREAMATGELSGELQTAAQNVALYAAQKALAQGADLRNEDDFAYLIELIKATGVATEAVRNLERAKASSARHQTELTNAQSALDAFSTNMYNKYGGNWSTKLNSGEYQQYSGLTNALNNAISNTEADDKSINKLITNISEEVDEAWKKQDPNLGIKFNYGGAVESAEAGGKEAAEAFKDALDKILAMYDAELDAGVITFQTYVDKSRQAIEQYYNEGKIKASEYYDYLANLYQKQVSEYDKVISAVQRLLKKQTDELQKQKESIEESYNLQIEEIQKKIDALRDENDEIDKNMALQKAQ